MDFKILTLYRSYLFCIMRYFQCGLLSSKESSCQFKRLRRHRFYPWVRKISWRKAWQPTPLFLPGESHGQRSLAGYSPQGHKELETLNEAEHVQVVQWSRIPLPMLETQEMWLRSPQWEDPPGEGSGNPLQYSCLENSMDRVAWWATVHGVAKSGARLSD